MDDEMEAVDYHAGIRLSGYCMLKLVYAARNTLPTLSPCSSHY